MWSCFRSVSNGSARLFDAAGFALVLGCITWAIGAGCGTEEPAPRVCSFVLPAACPAIPPSFRRDVDPILGQRCRPCHGPGGVSANVMLGSYAQVFAQRGHVLTQTYGCKMPPAPQPPLPDEQAQLLFTWLICNAPDN